MLMADWGSYKPLLTALVMPPLPFIVLILLGARLILPRRGLGYVLVLLGLAGVWLSSCLGVAVWLQDSVIKPPAPLPGAGLVRLEELGRSYAQQVSASRRVGRTAVPPAAIIALGGGREAHAREYGFADLSRFSAERLRYAVWLGRKTGLPLGFSGGVGWAQRADAGAAEADIAANVARQHYGVNLRWVENASADTRANALLTIDMLAQQGVPEVVLVTDAFHMPRAQQDFVEAAKRHARLHPGSPVIRVTPAAMGYWQREDNSLYDWVPSMSGAMGVRLALKECLARLVKA